MQDILDVLLHFGIRNVRSICRGYVVWVCSRGATTNEQEYSAESRQSGLQPSSPARFPGRTVLALRVYPVSQSTDGRHSDPVGAVAPPGPLAVDTRTPRR